MPDNSRMLRFRVLGAVGFALSVLFGVVPRAYAIPHGIPVTIESTPAGATVFMDVSTGLPLGTTPLRNVSLAAGTHTLIFQLTGNEEARVQVVIERPHQIFQTALTALSSIVISAGNDAANGAAVRIDGQVVGNVPTQVSVRAGRHLVQIGRESYVTVNQWSEVASGHSVNVVVSLEREAPQLGSLLVAADIAGAPIFVDGEPKGQTPTLIENLSPGSHSVQIRPENAPIFTTQVTIQPGQRASLTAPLRPVPATPTPAPTPPPAPTPVVVAPVVPVTPPPAPVVVASPPAPVVVASPPAPVVDASPPAPVVVASPPAPTPAVPTTGSVRVVVNPRGSHIFIDGDRVGDAPLTQENLVPGEHLVEAQADGFDSKQQTVMVVAGQQRAVSIALDLTIVTAPPRVVQAPVQQPPTQQPSQAEWAVRVVCNIIGAELFIDGTDQGPVPFNGRLPEGRHRFEVIANGYRNYIEVTEIVPAETARIISAQLVPGLGTQPVLRSTGEDAAFEQQAPGTDVIATSHGVPLTETQRDRIGAFTHAAGVLPKDLFVLDMSLGWPYLAELRLGAGLSRILEAGIAIRTFGRLTEFEGRVEAAYRPIHEVAIAAVGRIGGGIGPDHVNSFEASLEALGSLYFSNRGAFSLWLGMDMYTDRYPYLATNSSELIPNATRDAAARLRFGGSLEIVANDHWNFWGLIEGILAGNSRRIYGDFILNAQLDTKLYMRLGATYKF